MTDLHLIQTVASAIERGVPKHVDGQLRSDGFEDHVRPAEIDPTDAREFARAVLADLAAAGFRVTREEMATC